MEIEEIRSWLTRKRSYNGKWSIEFSASVIAAEVSVNVFRKQQ